MAVQIIRVRYVAETEDLDRAEATIRQQAAAAGVAESEVKDLNRQYAAQGKQLRANAVELRKMEQEAARLEKALHDAADPADQNRLQRELDETRQKIRRLRGDVDSVGKAGAKGLGGLGRVLEFAAGGLLAGGLIGIAEGIGSALTGLAQKSIGAAAAFEQTATSFEVLVGGADKAQQVLAELEQFSVSTPFTPEEVINTGRQLLAFGISTDKLTESLRRLGDVAAGTNTGLSDLAFVYGQIRTQQVAYTQDLLQFAGRGIPIFEILAQNLGTTAAGVKKLASEGKIGFKEIEDAFVTLTSEGGKFFNLTNAQSQTLNGRISTLQGGFQVLIRTIGQGLLPLAKQITDAFIGVVDFINRAFGPSTVDKLVKTQQGADVLFRTLERGNLTAEEQSRIIADINNKYGSYLPNLLSEKASTDEIAAARAALNTQLERTIRLQAAQEVTARVAQEQADAARQQLELQIELSQAEEQLARAKATVNRLEQAGVFESNRAVESAKLKVAGTLNEIEAIEKRIAANKRDQAAVEARAVAGSRAILQSLRDQGLLNDEIDLSTATADELRAALARVFSETGAPPPGLKHTQEDASAAVETLTTLKQKLKDLQTERANIDINDAQALARVDGLIAETKRKIATIEGTVKLKADAQSLQKQIESFNLQVKVSLAGGQNTADGLRILRDAELKQTEENKAFQALRVKDEQAANEVLIQERLKFAERIAAATLTDAQVVQERDKELETIRNTEEFKRAETTRQNEIILQVLEVFGQRRIVLQEQSAKRETDIVKSQLDIQKEEYSKQVAAASFAFQQREVETVRRLATIARLEQLSAEERTTLINTVSDERIKAEAAAYIEEGRYAEARKVLETDVTLSKIDSNRQYYQELRRLAEEALRNEEARIAALQAKVDAGTATQADQTELQSRTEAAQRLKEELLRIESELSAGIISEAEARAARQKAIDDDLLGSRIANAQAALSATSQLAAAFSDFFEAQKQRELQAAGENEAARAEIEKKAFKRQKAFAIAQAAISGAQAVLSVLAAAPGGLDIASLGFARIAQIAATIAVTGVQIATIAKAQPPGFREGVFELQGPGTETSDSIPARLSRGETVIPAAVGKEYRPAVKAIFEQAIPPEAINDFVVQWNAGRAPAEAVEPGAVRGVMNSIITKETLRQVATSEISRVFVENQQKRELFPVEDGMLGALMSLTSLVPSADYLPGVSNPIRYEATGAPRIDASAAGVSVAPTPQAYSTAQIKPAFHTVGSLTPYEVASVVDSPVSVAVDVGDLRQDMQALRGELSALAGRIAAENDTRMGQRIKILDQTIFDYLVKKKGNGRL